MTARERDIWLQARKMGKFTFGALLGAAGTTNRKAVSAALRKAEALGVLRKEGRPYVVQLS